MLLFISLWGVCPLFGLMKFSFKAYKIIKKKKTKQNDLPRVNLNFLSFLLNTPLFKHISLNCASRKFKDKKESYIEIHHVNPDIPDLI